MVRGASALCHLYTATDEQRFELIVSGLALGGNGSALADGAALATGTLAS
jgi:hypothetical protein